jgi:phage gp36-like protein
MGYCTENDLLKMITQEELAELTAEAGDSPDLLVVEEAIAKAGAELDAYLGVRYQVPVTPAPAQFKALAVDMAIYYLYTRRSAAPAVRRERYEAAARFLKDVAAGQAVVAGASGEPASTEREATEIASAARVFSRNSQVDW